MSTVHPRRRSVTTWLQRIGAVLVLTLLAFVGGVATTHLFPVHTETRYFSASISVQPSLSSTVLMPTVVGDMEVSFDGPVPAPGIVGQVQVRDELNELLRQGTLRTADLEPSSEELRTAINEGVGELAWKFAAGALVITALALFTYAVSHRTRFRNSLLASATASALAVVLPGAAAYLAYRVDNVQEFRTTSLLSLVENNTDILSGLDQKADQGAVYVTNLLALSAAMREEFIPAQEDATTAARFLLVSDLHGMNQYPLMREIVQTQDIDAVIDAGDLLNFGQPEEGQFTGIYDSIESLGVPYIFVRGNHDATSATDEGVLRRMAQIPNVVLLEPTRDELQWVEVNGVSITGFNDVRYFNERSDDFGAEQADLAAHYRELTDGMPLSDLVVTHQPYAADRVQAQALTLNGHMHSSAQQRGHLQIGSFTGGGLVNQFRIPALTEEAREAADEDPETAGELDGYPYSFDVLTFGEDCAVGTVTRYSYSNLVSGRPQFDDVSLINGRTLQESPPEEDRTCSADQGLTIRSLEEVRAEVEQGRDSTPTPIEVTPPDDAVVTTLPPRGGVVIEDDAATTGDPPR